MTDNYDAFPQWQQNMLKKKSPPAPFAKCTSTKIQYKKMNSTGLNLETSEAVGFKSFETKMVESFAEQI